MGRRVVFLLALVVHCGLRRWGWARTPCHRFSQVAVAVCSAAAALRERLCAPAAAFSFPEARLALPARGAAPLIAAVVARTPLPPSALRHVLGYRRPQLGGLSSFGRCRLWTSEASAAAFRARARTQRHNPTRRCLHCFTGFVHSDWGSLTNTRWQRHGLVSYVCAYDKTMPPPPPPPPPPRV
jgi:hypothetical protein